MALGSLVGRVMLDGVGVGRRFWALTNWFVCEL